MPATWKFGADRALVLRNCHPDMTSFGGFVWPRSGHVAAPDWDPAARCGNGLHGFLWGEGDASYSLPDEDAVWLVAVVDLPRVVDLDGKVKFPGAVVLFAGSRSEATRYLFDNGGAGKRIMHLVIEGGAGSNLVAGDHSVVKGGKNSTITAGRHSVVTGRDRSILEVGDRSTAVGGDWSRVTGGMDSHLGGGFYAIVEGGDASVVVGGQGSKVTGGAFSHVTGAAYAIVAGGASSVVTGGLYSLVSGGPNAVLAVRDTESSGFAVVRGCVGVDGLEPDVFYKLECGNLVRADDSEVRARLQ